MKILLWSLGGYAISYIIAVYVIRSEAHGKGCSLCRRYGEDCPCGYQIGGFHSWLNWMNRGMSGDNITLQVLFLLGALPFLVALIYIVLHIINPYHRKRCLSDILNGEANE